MHFRYRQTDTDIVASRAKKSVDQMSNTPTVIANVSEQKTKHSADAEIARHAILKHLDYLLLTGRPITIAIALQHFRSICERTGFERDPLVFMLDHRMLRSGSASACITAKTPSCNVPISSFCCLQNPLKKIMYFSKGSKDFSQSFSSILQVNMQLHSEYSEITNKTLHSFSPTVQTFHSPIFKQFQCSAMHDKSLLQNDTIALKSMISCSKLFHIIKKVFQLGNVGQLWHVFQHCTPSIGISFCFIFCYFYLRISV